MFHILQTRVFVEFSNCGQETQLMCRQNRHHLIIILIMTQQLFGNIHLISAICALLFGTWVLAKPKGTSGHRIGGYAYVISMVVMLLTSFLTYRLYGHFGLFHYLSVAASLTLMGGMLPMWLKKPIKSFRFWHFQFMYWSVIGLYMGLAAELLTRIPETPFLSMVILASTSVYILGIIGMMKFYKPWQQRHHLNHKPQPQ